ncbi:hypothetical protein [Pseudofrankia asymbiotica]|nr:hypothetical protein [Pseudofrankia asymbiotica]
MRGFVRMHDAGASPLERLALRGDEIALRFYGNFPDKPELLNGVLDSLRVDTWTGVCLPPMTSFATLKLWLATAFDGYCQLDLANDAATEPLAPDGRPLGDAVVDGRRFRPGLNLATSARVEDPEQHDGGRRAVGSWRREGGGGGCAMTRNGRSRSS